MRTFAILDKDNSTGSVEKLVEVLKHQNVADKIYVFTRVPDTKWNSGVSENVHWPNDINNDPAIRNWINLYLKTQLTHGFVHVVLSDTMILKDLTLFLSQLEKMMHLLDYDVWFNTICDRCNYVFNKHCPRVELILDDNKYNNLGFGDKMMFTSHCNTQWIAYNFDKVNDDLLRFDDSFTIPMFWIIEFLARRKQLRRDDQLYYMNQYVTVASEIGCFKPVNAESKPNDNNVLLSEDMLFKSKQVKFESDNNVDELLEHTYEKLNSSSKMI